MTNFNDHLQIQRNCLGIVSDWIRKHAGSDAGPLLINAAASIIEAAWTRSYECQYMRMRIILEIHLLKFEKLLSFESSQPGMRYRLQNLVNRVLTTDMGLLSGDLDEAGLSNDGPSSKSFVCKVGFDET